MEILAALIDVDANNVDIYIILIDMHEIHIAGVYLTGGPLMDMYSETEHY